MTDLAKIFQPQNAKEAQDFAVENLVFQVQIEIHKLMQQCGVDQAELASRIGVTPARVSQIFSKGGPNLTLRTIGRILHALGECGEFKVGKFIADDAKIEKRVDKERVRKIATNAIFPKQWNEDPANDNHAPTSVAA